MSFKTKRALGISLLLLLAAFSFTFFWPRNYDVLPPAPGSQLKYWELSTGSRIAYTLIPGQQPLKSSPIVYLHGGPGGFITEEIVALLRPLSKEGYTIYLYDQIGSGQSARLDDITEYTVDRHRKDLSAIIDKIGEEQVVLMGQSWGAMLGVSYLATHCEKVSKVIFTGPGPILPINYALAKQLAPDSLNLRQPAVSNAEGNRKVNNNRARFVQYVAHHFGVKIATDEEMDQFFTGLNSELKKSTVCDPATAKPSIGGGGYYAHIMTVEDLWKQVDHREKLAACQLPVLIIKGQCDNQPWGYGKEYLDLFENADLAIVPEAGHVFTAAQKEQFLAVVKGFLTEKKNSNFCAVPIRQTCLYKMGFQ